MIEHTRFKTVRRKLTFRERVEIWWEGVSYYWNQLVGSVFSKPPTETSDYVEVHPDDPDYNSAPWGLVASADAPRYRFENGGYVTVNPEEMSSESNPDWHAP